MPQVSVSRGRSATSDRIDQSNYPTLVRGTSPRPIDQSDASTVTLAGPSTWVVAAHKVTVRSCGTFGGRCCLCGVRQRLWPYCFTMRRGLLLVGLLGLLLASCKCRAAQHVPSCIYLFLVAKFIDQLVLQVGHSIGSVLAFFHSSIKKLACFCWCINYCRQHKSFLALSLDCAADDASAETEPEAATAEGDQPTVEEDLGASREGSRTDAEAVER